MLDVFVYALNAVMPILLLVLLGYMLKETGLFTPEWLRIANKFNFHYCLCALMFCNIYSLDGLEEIDVRLALFILVSLILLTALGFLFAHLLTNVHNRRGVLIQVVFRSNFAIIGLPLAESLGVAGGIALITAMQAPAIIYFNLMAVTVLSLYSDDSQTVDVKKTLLGIVKNPLIQGLVLGLLALCIRAVMPRTADGTLVFSLSGNVTWLYTAITNLSRIGTPLALVVLGGQFEFSAVRSLLKEIVSGVFLRLVFAPVFGFAAAFFAARMGWITITPAVIAVLIPLFSTPVAVSSSVMATEMHADDVLAGQLVVWTTLGSLVSLFVQIAGLRYVGLL